MRFVIVTHCYGEFLDWLYRCQPQLVDATFAAQRAAYHATLFGSADFYVEGLRGLGHEVEEFVVNNGPSQRAWLREHGEPDAIAAPGVADARTPHPVGLIRQLRAQVHRWLGRSRAPAADAPPIVLSPQSSFRTLIAQLKKLRPDVVYNQSVFAFDNAELDEMKCYCDCLVGEHAATTLPDHIDYARYGLIVSSFPPTLEWLRGRGGRAALNRLAFDPRVLDFIPEVQRDVGVSFVGSFFEVHRSRLRLIEAVAQAAPDIAVHGNVTVEIEASSPLRGKIGPPLWGRDMFALLSRSQLTLNHHGDVPPFANNMRLYEATGMGCLLVTDHKDNLGEIFEPGKEIISYRDAEECCDKVRYYVDDRHASERARIMAAGQQRTLRDHTYKARMKHLINLIEAL
jgi:spore maturation protein CgeB